MTQLETTGHEPAALSPRHGGLKLFAIRAVGGLVLALIAIVSFFALSAGRTLWREYHLLRQDLAAVEHSAVIGYPGISPQLNYAERPQVWFRQEGDSVLLWAGWVHGHGHHWYRATMGDMDPARLLRPHPAVVAMAIDYPTVERSGGTIWQKMPDDVHVVGHVLAGRHCVYPLPVLMRVEVINDVVDERPFLVTGNVLPSRDHPCSIFDAALDGRRVTMAPSGYYHDRQPVLYDRGTQSLWTEQEDGLTAIAGENKGKKLARLARPDPVAWRSWRSSNPHIRLVVGGDRTQGIPTE